MKKREYKGQILKEPLTEEEQHSILEASKKLGDYQGIDAHRTILLFLRTGIHPEVIAFRDKSRIHVEDDYLVWYRPKKKGSPAKIQLLIHSDIKDWVEEFINDDLPDYTEFYWALFKVVGKKAKVPELSGMSFRHTMGVYLDEIGCSPYEISQILNCSIKVAQRYSKRTQKMIDDKLRGSGW